jgi:hypothetical protein
MWGLFEALSARVWRDAAPPHATLLLCHASFWNCSTSPARPATPPRHTGTTRGRPPRTRCVSQPRLSRGTHHRPPRDHAPRGWPWHGLGGKIQILGFREGTRRGWQTVILGGSMFSSMSRSVPIVSSISNLWH